MRKDLEDGLGVSEPAEAALIERVLDLAIQIQQIPAPTFLESARAEFVRDLFVSEGLSDVEVDAIGNVYARLNGRGVSPPLVISAHTDTVFPQWTDLTVTREEDRIYGDRISGPGIGDNSLGVAALLGLVWQMQLQKSGYSSPKNSYSQGDVHSETKNQFPGDLWLVANVGEEGLGDLRGMRAVVDRFGGNVLGYIILEGMSLGQVYHRGLGVERYRITVETPGGHSWVNYGSPSAIHELAGIVMRLLDLPIPRRPRASINVGVIEGGTSVNTIAAKAHLELDLRSEDEKTLANLMEQVKALVSQRALVLRSQHKEVKMTCELIGKRPPGRVPLSHPLVRTAGECLQLQGINPVFSIGSTDANIPLSKGYPAVCIGLTRGNGAHTTAEFIETGPLIKGLAQLVLLVDRMFSPKPQR